MAKVHYSIYFIILFNFINCSYLKESVKLRHRREAVNITEYKNVPAAISSVSEAPANAVNNNNSSILVNSTLQGGGLENKSKDAKQQPPETAVSPSGITGVSTVGSTMVNTVSTIPIPIPVTKDRPLLGVNGTGQRKDYLSTPLKATTVSDPISSEKITKLSMPKKFMNESQLLTQSSITSNSTEDFVDEVEKTYEDTEKDKKVNNINQTETDYHIYYNSSNEIDVAFAKKYLEIFGKIAPNTMLSKSHRRAMTVQLSFEFPFYGHPVRNVTVATGGFLYTGDYVHSWLAATQYIAPLMANFDTSLSNNSFVKYSDNGTAFTVLWENVSLQDKQDVGPFTFSATLHKNGDIVFIYYSIPIFIESIQDDKHPVKVGLSDAYIIDKVIFFARRKTIYEYHRVNFANLSIRNSTIIYLFAQPTCLSFTDCKACLTKEVNFNCTWCPTLNKCSTGTDRKRQDWLHKGCDRTQITNENVCPALGEKGNNAAKQKGHSGEFSDDSDNNGWSSLEHNDSSVERLLTQDKSVIRSYDKSSLETSASVKHEESGRVGLALGLMLPICFVLSALVWMLYAYRNPHTKSGQLLIQYRPSQWTWRRGEARYTAATIHM